jgi:hypothetical protein
MSKHQSHLELLLDELADRVAQRLLGAGETGAQVVPARTREAAKPVPRLALTKAEAARAIGVSVDHLERHVQPSIACVYSGRRRLFAITELEKWLAREAIS